MTFKDYLLIGAAVVICCVTWRGCQDGKAWTGERTTIRISEKRADSLERIGAVYRHQIKHLLASREAIRGQKAEAAKAYAHKPPASRISEIKAIFPKVANYGDTGAYVPLAALDTLNLARIELAYTKKELATADSTIAVQEVIISNDSALIAEKTSQAGKWKSIAVSEGKRADRSFWKGLLTGGAAAVVIFAVLR